MQIKVVEGHHYRVTHTVDNLVSSQSRALSFARSLSPASCCTLSCECVVHDVKSSHETHNSDCTPRMDFGVFFHFTYMIRSVLPVWRSLRHETRFSTHAQWRLPVDSDSWFHSEIFKCYVSVFLLCLWKQLNCLPFTAFGLLWLLLHKIQTIKTNKLFSLSIYFALLLD